MIVLPPRATRTGTLCPFTTLFLSYTGQVEGFERSGAAQRKRDEEAAVLAWLREQGDDGKPALEAHDQLVALATDARATRERDLVVSRFHTTGVLHAALPLYRRAIEHDTPHAPRAAVNPNSAPPPTHGQDPHRGDAH